jgi:hypothetical protein
MAIEVDTYICKWCRQPIPDGTSRSHHEDKCTENPKNNVKRSKTDMRKKYNEDIYQDGKLPRKPTKVVKGWSKGSENHTYNLCQGLRQKMDNFIPSVFLSRSEFIRAAIIDFEMNPVDNIDIGVEGYVGLHSNVVDVHLTKIPIDILYKVSGNQSEACRVIVSRYVKKLWKMLAGLI